MLKCGRGGLDEFLDIPHLIGFNPKSHGDLPDKDKLASKLFE